MTVTNEQIDITVEDCRARSTRLMKVGLKPSRYNAVITALADQRAELVALLRESQFTSQCVTAFHSEDDPECQDVVDGCGEPCPEHRRRALLARIGVTP